MLETVILIVSLLQEGAGQEEGGKIWNKRKDYEIGKKNSHSCIPPKYTVCWGEREREKKKWSKQQGKTS